MKFLEYYFQINIYIIFFEVFFLVFLKKESFFQGTRIYLTGSVFLSLLLPCLHNISPSVSFIYEQLPYTDKVSGYITAFHANSTIQPSSIPIDWGLAIKIIIALGSFIMLLFHIIYHIKIHSIINRSKKIEYKNLHIALTSKPVVPFLYNNSIVIPTSLAKDETDIIIEHEYQHHKLGHYIDNFLLQVFQIIFWVNPFIYLLKRDLKLIHEYQVDSKLIKKGINACVYKLTLIKFSVGFQKFAVANELSNSKIKKRIIMMNNTSIKKWRWKFLLFIPAFFFVFLILGFTSMNNALKPDNLQQLILNNSNDSVKIELTTISPEELKKSDDKDLIIIMINRKSQILFNIKERSSFNTITNKIVDSFQERTTDEFKELTNDLLENLSPKIKIVVQKSNRTDTEDYNKLLNCLSSGIYKLQEIYSNKVFGKSYSLLTPEDQNKINNLVQPRLYILPDKNL